MSLHRHSSECDASTMKCAIFKTVQKIIEIVKFRIICKIHEINTNKSYHLNFGYHKRIIKNQNASNNYLYIDIICLKFFMLKWKFGGLLKCKDKQCLQFLIDGNDVWMTQDCETRKVKYFQASIGFVLLAFTKWISLDTTFC